MKENILFDNAEEEVAALQLAEIVKLFNRIENHNIALREEILKEIEYS